MMACDGVIACLTRARQAGVTTRDPRLCAVGPASAGPTYASAKVRRGRLQPARPMSLTIFTSDRFADHLNPPGHPERLERAEVRSEEHTSELHSPCNLVCRLLLEKKKNQINSIFSRIQKTRSKTPDIKYVA